MASTRAKVVCRVCQEWGYEDADDPCPGLCPPCFQDALDRDTEVMIADRWERGLTIEECMRRQDRRLAAIGCSPAMRQQIQASEAADLADDIAAERRGN